MTVPNIDPVNNYSGNGSVTTFDFDFLIENENELVVLHTNSAGVQTCLNNNIDYTINEIGVPDGSFITFPKAGSSYGVLQNNEILSLLLDLEAKQEKEITNSGKLYLQTIEWCFDYVTRILQIISRKIERCVKVGEGSDINPDNLLNEILTTFSESLAGIGEATQEAIATIFDETLEYAKIEYVDGEINEVNEAINTKVDKVSGMGLSAENFTTSEKEKLAGISENANNYTLPDDVVQDSDYVHTDNNFTNSEKSKLTSIENGANKYVLPSNVVRDENYTHTDNNFTGDEKAKLAELNNYTLLQAASTVLGGVKADTKLSTDTQPVRIDPATGKLFTAPGTDGGGSGESSGCETTIVNAQWGQVEGTLSEQADLNTALGARELLSNKASTITTSTTEYPTSNAVKTYIDSIAGNIETLLQEI